MSTMSRCSTIAAATRDWFRKQCREDFENAVAQAVNGEGRVEEFFPLPGGHQAARPFNLTPFEGSRWQITEFKLGWARTLRMCARLSALGCPINLPAPGKQRPQD